MYNVHKSINTRAEERRNEWVATHGSHEWDKRNLRIEAQEELADAWNYLLVDMVNCDLTTIKSHTRALELIHKAWEEIEYPYRPILTLPLQHS